MSGLLKRIFGGGGDDMAAQAQEAMAGATEMTGAAQGLTDQAKDLMEGGVPDVAELKKAVDGLSPEQLQSVTQKALDTLPTDTRSQLGQAIQGFASKTGGKYHQVSRVAIRPTSPRLFRARSRAKAVLARSPACSVAARMARPRAATAAQLTWSAAP